MFDMCSYIEVPEDLCLRARDAHHSSAGSSAARSSLRSKRKFQTLPSMKTPVGISALVGR
jgi:hypothetical protein